MLSYLINRNILLFLLVSAMASAQPRQKRVFNNDWKFQIGDVNGGEGHLYPDSQWEEVGLPHSFSIPYFMSPDFYVGYGWYRKHFTPEKEWDGKHVIIEFEAAFQVAEVFVNGKAVGTHKGGYTGFQYDLTPYLTPGDNVIAVRVNNIWDPGLAPRAGEHVFSGGIYRDVYLNIVDPLHVDWYGTFVTTPKADKTRASVAVSIDIKNAGEYSGKITVATEIVSPAGISVAKVSDKIKIGALSSHTILQHIPEIKHPELWRTDTPFLYKAITRIYVKSRLADEYETVFGIRDIKWTADQGFLLNGERLYLKGANVHQDHAGWGDAVSNTGFQRDVQLMKDAGFNFIRGSHYPHDPAFVKACDSIGVLYWSENVFWGIGGSDQTPEGYWNSSAYPTQEKDRAPFEQSLGQQLEEMIRIHRNSPSILAWSMSNEPFFTAKSTIGNMRECLKKMVALSHKLDPTRAAAIGGAQRPLDDTRIDRIGDIAGYNGDGGRLEVFQNPGVPSIVSEYGSVSSDRPGAFDPGWNDIKEYQGADIFPWRGGQAVWCGFDHGSIAGAALGKMGVVDYFRIPKRAWYYYRDLYLKLPAPVWPIAAPAARIQLKADRLQAQTDGTEDIYLQATILGDSGSPVDSNTGLTLTIVSGPGEFPTGKAITFEKDSDIRIQDGQAAIEIRSFYAGKTVVRALSQGLEPVEIELTFNGGELFEPGISPERIQRPYKRFESERKATLQQFGRNNPTFCSSSAKGYPSGLAADGNIQTFWRPEKTDKAPYLTLFTEKRLDLNDAVLYFPNEAVYRYTVEVSEDDRSWTTVADYSENKKAVAKQKILLEGYIGSSIRVRFVGGSTAELSEIEVSGTVKN